MGKDVEVRTRLKLEDLSSAVLAKVKGGFEKADAAQKQAQSGFRDFASSFASTFAAVNVAPLAGRVYELGKSFVAAGASGDQADKEIAGLIASAQGAPWEKAIAQAGAYNDALDGVAIGARKSTDEVGGAFKRLLEIQGASAQGLERATKDTAALATISGVLGKETAALGAEYAFMSEGVVKTKGQLFQLLQTTGIFGKETKKAAEHWSKLTEEQRLQALNFGLGRVADRLGKTAPTFSDLATTLSNVADIAKEKLGQGLISELMPDVEAFVSEIAAGREEIDKTAEGMGREIGRHVREAAKEVRRGYEYVREHYAEIKQAVIQGFDYAKKVVGWILDHKGELAVAFGAKALPGLGGASAGGTALKAGSKLVGGAASLGSALAPALEAGALGKTVAGLTSTLGGAAIGVTGLAVAIGLLGGAALATNAIIEEQNAESKAHMDALDNVWQAANEGNVRKVEDLVSAMRSLGSGINSLGEPIGFIDQKTHDLYESLKAAARVQQGIDERQHQNFADQIALASRGIESAYARASTDTSKAGQDYAANMYANQAAILINAYNEATKAGNSAMASLAATTIASSKGAQLAFLQAAGDVEGGFQAMADIVLAGGSQFADFATKLRAKVPADAKTQAAPSITFNNAKIEIKQDLRGEDPDRIALYTRRDLVKTVTNRYAAVTGTPFGG